MQKSKINFVSPNPMQKSGINHNSPPLKDLRKLIPGLKSQDPNLKASGRNTMMHNPNTLLNNGRFLKQTHKSPLLNSKNIKDEVTKRRNPIEKKQALKNVNDKLNENQKIQKLYITQQVHIISNKEEPKQQIKQIAETKTVSEQNKQQQQADWLQYNTVRAHKNLINNDNQQLLLNQLEYSESDICRIKSMPNLVDPCLVDQTVEVLKNQQWIKIQDDTMKGLQAIQQQGCRHRGHEHNKLQIVCLNCRTVVCAHCIIFGNYNGQHKTHTVIPLKQFMDELGTFLKYCESDLKNKSSEVKQIQSFIIDSSQKIQQSEGKTNKNSEVTSRLSATNVGKAVLAKRQQIHTKISNMIKKLQQNQQNLYKQLQKHYNKIEQGYGQEQKKKQQIRGHLRKSYQTIALSINKLTNKDISIGERVRGVNQTIEVFYQTSNKYKNNVLQLMGVIESKVERQQDQKFIMGLNIVPDNYIQHNLGSCLKLEVPEKPEEIFNYFTPIKIKFNKPQSTSKIDDQPYLQNQFISQFTNSAFLTDNFQLNLPSSRILENKSEIKSSNRLTKAKSVDNLHSLYQKELMMSFQMDKSDTSKKMPEMANIDNFTPAKLELQSFSQSSSILLQQQTAQQSRLSKIINQCIVQLNNDKYRTKILNLSNKNLTSEQVQKALTHILDKTNKKSIRSINLSGNKIDNQGISMIISLNMMSCVSNLNLSHTLCNQKILDVVITNKDKLAPLRLINLKGNNIKLSENLNAKIKNLSKMGMVICI